MDDGGLAPTDIDRIKGKGKDKGKGKGKGWNDWSQGYKGGKGKDKGKGKGRGKDWNDWSQGYKGGKGKDKGKGKSKGGQKGPCHTCGRMGHLARDCWGQSVQHISSSDTASTASGPSAAPSSAVSSSASSAGSSVSTAKPRVNRVGATMPMIVELDDSDREVDLTIFALESDSEQHVNMVQFVGASDCMEEQSTCFAVESCASIPVFDMSADDGNDEWTVFQGDSFNLLDPDDWSLEGPRVLAVSTGRGRSTEIVMDSGADASVLPLSFLGIGESVQPESTGFSDAQGHALKAFDWRLCTVELGNVRIRERFLVSNVTCPLLASGKLHKAGWGIMNNGDGPVFVRGDDKRIPCWYRRNSLMASAHIRVVAKCDTAQTSNPGAQNHSSTAQASNPGVQNDGSMAQASNPMVQTSGTTTDSTSSQPFTAASDQGRVNAVMHVKLSTVLQRMLRHGEFFAELIPGVFGIRCQSSTYLDIHMLLPNDGVTYRTTLVGVAGYPERWQILEFCEDVDVLEDPALPLSGISAEVDMIVLATREAMSPVQLGLEELGEAVTIPAAVERADHDMLESSDMALESVVDDGYEPPAEVPNDPRDEAAVEAAFRDDNGIQDELVIDGVTIRPDSALRVMRQACENLGIGRSGGKAKVYKRLNEHVKRMALLEQHQAAAAAQQQQQRNANEVPMVREPTLHERNTHALTHVPYASWCETCVQHKGRSDKHKAVVKDNKSMSTLSFDYSFTERPNEAGQASAEKLACLALADRHTGWREAIPCRTKAADSYIVTEVVRLLSYLGHGEICLKSDAEPTCKALQTKIQVTRAKLGLRTVLEYVPEEEKASNGAAEQAVETCRQHGNILLAEYEKATNKRVSTTHPLHSWAMRHGCWLVNRYHVQGGATPFEAAFQKPYDGKIVCFGEAVLGLVRTTIKGAAKWLRGLWLGKAVNNDAHLICTVGGKLVLCRSIRRTVNRFDPELRDVVKDFPWQHPGFVAGSGGRVKLQKSGRPVESEVLAAPVSPVLAEFDAMEARASAKPPPGPDEAGSDATPTSQVEHGSLEGYSPDEQAAGVPMSTSSVDNFPAGGDIEDQGPGGDSGAGAMEQGGDERPAAEGERASKAPRVGVVNYCENMDRFHADEVLVPEFTNDAPDNLQDYDLQFWEETDLFDEPENGESGIGTSGIPEELWFPFSEHEPSIEPGDLEELDAIGDAYEVDRLLGMGVLRPADDDEIKSHRLLSTKMVRSWRVKEREGQAWYLRRSRWVAREYTWLDPEKEVAFAPASSSLLLRLLPSYVMRKRNEGGKYGVATLDITDAFLTVDQKEDTVVKAWVGEWRFYKLLKLLPGQRDGTSGGLA